MNAKKFMLLAATASLTCAIHVDELTAHFPVLKTVHMVSEAEAVMGVRRRTRRRTAVVAYSAGSAKAQQQAAAQAAATTPAPAPAPAPAQATPPQVPAPAQPAGAPPLGSIATVLPDGCSTEAISGVQYNNCSGVYYRTAFQGNNLVYVVAQP